MAPTAADVPGVYDLVLNSQGYMFAEPSEDGRARYTYTQTFLTRQNVGDAYGDNQQDFFLTVGQNDWSLGENQKFYRITDDDRKRRYYASSGVDPITVPGQVTLRNTVASLTFAGAVRALCDTQSKIYAANVTNLYSVNTAGSITDAGAHGLGAAPSQWGLIADASNIYASTSAAGTVGIRKYTGAAYSTFSATGVDSLAFLGNTLYGYSEATGILSSFSTAGAATTIYTWKDAAGAALTGAAYQTRIRPFGGKLYLLRKTGIRGRAELWQYDGTATSQLAEFPVNLIAGDLEEVSGVAFVSGYLDRNSDKLPAIYYFVNGTMGRLWKAQVVGYTNATWPAMTPYDEGLAFTDDTTGSLMLYNIATGGVHTLGTYTVTNATPMMAGNSTVLVHTRNATAGYYFPSSSVAASATVDSSLFDFDNSLTKQFRGIKADCTVPTGATFDISYQVNAVTGSWTSLQTTATAGTEYTLTGISGQSIAVRVTLNKGSSSAGPTLKRVYVRASPLLQSYRRGEYLVDCTGRDGRNIKLRNGVDHPLDGLAMATNLATAITATSPFTITDRFGSYTAQLEPDQCEFVEVRPEEFVARVKARQL